MSNYGFIIGASKWMAVGSILLLSTGLLLMPSDENKIRKMKASLTISKTFLFQIF